LPSEHADGAGRRGGADPQPLRDAAMHPRPHDTSETRNQPESTLTLLPNRSFTLTSRFQAFNALGKVRHLVQRTRTRHPIPTRWESGDVNSWSSYSPRPSSLRRYIDLRCRRTDHWAASARVSCAKNLAPSHPSADGRKYDEVMGLGRHVGTEQLSSSHCVAVSFDTTRPEWVSAHAASRT